MANHFKQAIPFIIITILAIGGVEIFYRIPVTRFMQINRKPQVQEVGTKIAVSDESGQKKRPDSQAIIKRNLFGPSGKEAKAPTTEQPAPDKLAATTLELSLLGTITGPPNTRRAILLDKKKKVQDIYYQGDTVQGALIKEVQRGKIILNVNGKEEILVPETPKTNPGAATNPDLSSSMPPEAAGQEPPAEIPVEGVVEPQPMVTPEPAEPVAPTVNTTVESNAPEVEKAEFPRPQPEFSPTQQNNLPNTNRRPNINNPPNTNNNQVKP